MDISFRRDFLKTLAAAPAILSAAAAKPVMIDLGRQLFVDDLLAEHSSLLRRFHKPFIHASSPVLKPETPLEMNNGYCPVACPFQDGVFYDPADRLFKIWYHAGWFDGTAYAYSEDGIRWVRPSLDIERGTNRILPRRDHFQRDGAGIWLDLDAAKANERFKMFAYFRQRSAEQFHHGELDNGTVVSEGGYAYVSPDGVHWSAPVRTGPCGDNTNFFYNPFRRTWFYSIRTFNRRGRIRSYRECRDFLRGAKWSKTDVQFLASADDQDAPDPDTGYETQLYNLDAVAYESLMLGVFAIHKGPPNEVCEKGGFPKITDLNLAYSRDGIHWDRPDRTAFLACSRKPGAWNRGYLHSSGGVCLVVGDELRFYFGAFSGISPRLGGHMYAGGSTGLATLRRDGFASMDAGPEGGELTTRPVIFSGRHLFVNADAKAGELRVAILGLNGEPLVPFTSRECVPISGDSTRKRVIWKSAEDVSGLRHRPVRLRFECRNLSLYSFWISPSEAGASRGYVAAGGPGFGRSTDV